MGTNLAQCQACGRIVPQHANLDGGLCDHCAPQGKVAAHADESGAAPTIGPGPVSNEARTVDQAPFTLRSIAQMVLAAPLGGVASCAAALVIMFVGGAVTELLLWLTGGVTALTGRVFVFQLLLLVIIGAVILLTWLVAWVASGVCAAMLTIQAGLSFDRLAIPSRNHQVIAAALAVPTAAVAYYVADRCMWAMFVWLALMGTVNYRLNERANEALRQELMTTQKQQAEGLPVDALALHKMKMDFERLNKERRLREEAEYAVRRWEVFRTGLLWLGCLVAAASAVIGIYSPDTITGIVARNLTSHNK